MAKNKLMITLSKKFLANDKTLESLVVQLEGFNSVIKNQLSFNKMIETQVAQLASSCPNNNFSVVTTQIGKSTQELPFP